MTAVTEPRSARSALSLFGGGRFYGWLTLFSLAVGALSLHYPSTPSYDPWSWLLWGREIYNWATGTGPVANQALTIAGGSSWKPLPVIFTTVFALFGSAQPNLWLIVARAGAVLTVLMAIKLTLRISWALTTRGRAHDWFAELDWSGRLSAIAPALLAGAIALVGVSFTPTFPGNMALGYSEGVMVAAALVAAERAWDGHHRQAFVIGIIPALDRPEFWLIWGPYGLWLMWKDPGARALVVGLAVLMLAFWVVPQKLGGGTVKGLVNHPLHNHSYRSAVNSTFPFWRELSHVVWPLALERVEIAALIEMALTAVLVIRAKRTLGSWLEAVRSYGAAAVAALASSVGFLWWLLISLETQVGFAGNARYAILGSALIYVGGCAAYAWACLGLARLAGWLLSRWSHRASGWRVRTGASATLMLAIFLFVPGWFAHRLPTIASIRASLRYQARVREEVAFLVQHAGGAKKVYTCGSMMTNNLQVTLVAWYLDIPIPWIQALPQSLETKLQGPNVVFQNGTSSDTVRQQQPSDAQMTDWNQGWQKLNHSKYTIVSTDPVTLYMDCSSYSKT
jgi:hypothetical protein